MLLSLEASGTLGFVLNGVSHPNGSTVLNTDIGEGAAALQCTTDSTTCCTNQNGETRAGEFYFPEGIDVPREGNSPTNQVPRAGDSATSPYYRERHSRSISLNRRSDIPAQPTGQFRCEIPDASGTTVNLFINIGMLIKIELIITKRVHTYKESFPHYILLYSGATANHHCSTHHYHRINYYHSTNDHHSSICYHSTTYYH